MSQEKLSLEQAAIFYNANVTGEYSPEQNRKAFIAGARFREAQLMEIVNEMKQALSFYIDRQCFWIDGSLNTNPARQTLTKVNKALDEMGLE